MDEIFKNTCYNKNNGICHKAAVIRTPTEQSPMRAGLFCWPYRSDRHEDVKQQKNTQPTESVAWGNALTIRGCRVSARLR